MGKKMDKKPTNKKNEFKEDSPNESNSTEKIEDNKKKPEPIKQLEGKEVLQIEYFSIEELKKKIEEFKKKLEDKEEELKKFSKESENWKNKYMLLQAEFENAQKRWDKSRQDLRTQNNAAVLKNFLPLYDSFKKAIANLENNEDPLIQFFNQFLNIFKSYQAEPLNISINESFDYNSHEALTTVENEDLPENSIVDIIQDGWKMGKNVLRYAKVVVSKKPKPPEPEHDVKQEEGEAQIEEQNVETELTEGKKDKTT